VGKKCARRGLAASAGNPAALGSRALKLLPCSGRDLSHKMRRITVVFRELSMTRPVYPDVGGIQLHVE
jgi:hypothetical protein